MLHFECDYLEGAHPRIMERLVSTNLEQNVGYGEDPHCQRACELIGAACGVRPQQVHFLVGGTQANATIIDAILRPWQGVISAHTGHINVHESGAVEATGHKVIAIDGVGSKLTADGIRRCVEDHFHDATREHMVQPGMVYISFPTENGELYSEAELTAIKAVCEAAEIPLFIDGARLGYGLNAPDNDLTLETLAELCDVFYIGGTKVGALFGEAVVFSNAALGRDFRYMIKRHGGMLAKGRLLGIQFETLFEDGLYDQISRRAVELALKLKAAFVESGFPLYADSPTNQQFPILTKAQAEALSKKYGFAKWADVGEGRVAVRFSTSWATTEEQVDALISDIRAVAGR